MVCKGECIQYKAGKVYGKNDRYQTGQKRCSVCELFIIWDGKRCPCCGYMLRTNPRGTLARQQMLIVKQVKRI
ncbi:MAG: hypothetical protein OEM77_07995 [Nitrosopumilus sp.]|nr:hypothetical protein [Nitrosopumilus sp.]MDH3736383.1 hypothetical protein [Nitrosopumilus sp.]MDH3823120.1 hypothetical protein [Nitrosopumilus sp.]MDH3833430.1 hypothetical protein [Nitrosopumilus sp.]